MTIITGHTTRAPGTILTAAIYNTDHTVHIANANALNATKIEGATPPVVAGHVVVFADTSGAAIASGGFVPQSSILWTATTIGGTANAITVTATTPAIASYTLAKGNTIALQPTAPNTGAVTLNINTLGAIAVLKQTFSGLVALSGGELQTNNVYHVYYDGTQYILLAMPDTPGTKTTLASAATTDLGTIGSHFVLISGTTGITSFGSSANVAQPLYFVKFSGVLTITQGANIVTPGGGNITTAVGDTALMEYLGAGVWSILTYWPANPPTAVGCANGLTITNTTATPTTQMDVTTVGRSILENTSGAVISVGPQTLTINAATTGINALDAGSLANSTWYHVYLISNGSTTAALLSTSATAPTMPTGYVYKYRIGAVRTGGAATFLRTLQRGNRTQYQVVAASTTPNYPIVVTGATGSPTTPTYTTFSMATFTPPTSTSVQGSYRNAAAGNVTILSPNAATGINSSNTNPPMNTEETASGNAFNSKFDMLLETQNIFVAATGANNVVFITGWTDAVNAN